MVSVVLSALRERRAQTVALFLLTILAALGGCAAPWFQGWARDAVSSADIAASPLEQRVVTVGGSVPYLAGEASPVPRLRETVEASLPVAGGSVVTAMNIFAQARPIQSGPAQPATGPAGGVAGGTAGGAAGHPTEPAGQPGEDAPAIANMTIGYRENVCSHLVITGACATGPGQVLLGERVAATLHVRTGDRVSFSGLELAKPVVLTVSGLYGVADVLSPYWASAPAASGTVAATVALNSDEPAFTTEQTLLAAGPDNLDLSYQLVLPPDAFHDSGAPLQAMITSARQDLRPALSVRTSVDTLVEKIHRDQSLVTTGIYVATLQLVLLCWFALYLAVRYTSDARRPDIGLLKLRGAAGWRVWGLTALQSAVPMIAGAVLGWGLGRVAAAALAGSTHAGTTDALLVSLAIAAGVGIGALLVCVVAETRTLRSPVTTLMRRVPARLVGWRAQAGDLVVVVLAVAGVYQGYADLRTGSEISVLALLAPGLVGLAVAVVAGRALPWLAAWGGKGALAAGRAGAALTALHVARRPGTQRVFAVIAVAVCVLSSTLFFWQTSTDAWTRRSVAQLGAATVLTVRAENSTTLLAAVRAADPAGRYAMAVARGSGASAGDRVLAVDTSRLAAVALLPPELGLPDPATLARLLHPPAPAPPTVTDGVVTLDAGSAAPQPATGVDGTGPDPDASAPVQVAMHLVDQAGNWHDASFGPLTVGRHTYQATVSGCPSGCRLAAFEPVTRRAQATVDLYGLEQKGRADVTAPQFADISRWRPPTGPGIVGTDIAAGDGRLSMSLYTGGVPQHGHVDRRVFAVAAPSPLPLAAVGSLSDPTSRPGDARLAALGAEEVPYAVVATGNVLPRFGAAGSMMDLEYAELSNSGQSETVSLEVWLTADAPPSIVDSLSKAGIEVVGQDGVGAATARLRSQGPGVALRFELFAAIVALLVAAGTILVASAVERRPRAEELAALRAQGLREATMRRAAYAGTGVLAAAAILVGMLAALISQAVVATSLPVFTDSWTLLPVREGPWPLPALLTFVAALVGVGGAAAVGAARTVRAVQTRAAGGDW